MSIRKHVLSVTVLNKPGVLMRLASLFARRGFNIDSLAVAKTERESVSRTTFVVTGEDSTIEQAKKQLEKLIDVLSITDHTELPYIDRELMLIKVAIKTPEDRVEVRQIAQDFRARIVDVHREALIFEVTGDEGKMEAFIQQMSVFGIIELIRSGQIALTRTAADSTTKVNPQPKFKIQHT